MLKEHVKISPYLDFLGFVGFIFLVTDPFG